MAKSDFGTIIGLGIAGVGAYWLYTSGLLSSLFGTTTTVAAAPATGVIPATTPPPTTTSIVPVPVTQTPTTATANPNTLQSQIQALAGASTTMLTPDQWDYYYNQVLAGRSPAQAAVSPASFEAVLGSLGLSDATRGTQVSLPQFMAALQAQGLSGVRNNARNFRRVNYVSPARYAGGNYHVSSNTSPVGGF